jgi:mRNA degradation ribonuclease J1/J2
VQQVLDAAVAHQRKVVYVGRSMVRNMGVARDLGYLRIPPNTLIEQRDIDDYPPEDVVIVSTGSQGEPLSALSRMAHREHPVIQLKSGDTVVLASSLIPGNESAVYRVINGRPGSVLMWCIEGMRSFTYPGMPARGSCSTATTSSGPAMSCRCTARCGI